MARHDNNHCLQHSAASTGGLACLRDMTSLRDMTRPWPSALWLCLQDSAPQLVCSSGCVREPRCLMGSPGSVNRHCTLAHQRLNAQPEQLPQCLPTKLELEPKTKEMVTHDQHPYYCPTGGVLLISASAGLGAFYTTLASRLRPVSLALNQRWPWGPVRVRGGVQVPGPRLRATGVNRPMQPVTAKRQGQTHLPASSWRSPAVPNMSAVLSGL